MQKTLSSLILEYFTARPNQPLAHGEVVDWVTEKWLLNHPDPPRDPWRAIRKLHQDGKLVKVAHGEYMYDPDFVHDKELKDFSEADKQKILNRDGYRCVICGKGIADGVKLAVDHIKPKDKGGENTIDNGQTLCYEHNLLKKNYSQTEAGKRYFIKMYERALKNYDENMIRFAEQIFNIYNQHDIDTHIDRPDR